MTTVGKYKLVGESWRERKHGSPYDRGSADAYYDRAFNPHWYPEGTYNGYPVKEEDMTPEQIEDYRLGYIEQDNRKD